MNFSEILETVDTYAREYIRYVLSVASRTAFKAEAADFDPKLINFSLISVALGSYLFDRFVRHAGLSQGDLIDRMVRIFSTWLFIGVVLYAGLNLRSKIKIAFSPSLSIVLRVLPVAFMLSTYVATVVAQVARLFASPACAGWWGYLGLSVNETVIILMFLPISIARYVEYDHAPGEGVPEGHHYGVARTLTLSLLVVAIIMAVRVFAIVGEFASLASATSVVKTAACHNDKACQAAHTEPMILKGELTELSECFRP